MPRIQTPSLPARRTALLLLAGLPLLGACGPDQRAEALRGVLAAKWGVSGMSYASVSGTDTEPVIGRVEGRLPDGTRVTIERVEGRGRKAENGMWAADALALFGARAGQAQAREVRNTADGTTRLVGYSGPLMSWQVTASELSWSRELGGTRKALNVRASGLSGVPGLPDGIDSGASLTWYPGSGAALLDVPDLAGPGLRGAVRARLSGVGQEAFDRLFDAGLTDAGVLSLLGRSGLVDLASIVAFGQPGIAASMADLLPGVADREAAAALASADRGGATLRVGLAPREPTTLAEIPAMLAQPDGARRLGLSIEPDVTPASASRP